MNFLKRESLTLSMSIDAAMRQYVKRPERVLHYPLRYRFMDWLCGKRDKAAVGNVQKMLTDLSTDKITEKRLQDEFSSVPGWNRFQYQVTGSLGLEYEQLIKNLSVIAQAVVQIYQQIASIKDDIEKNKPGKGNEGNAESVDNQSVDNRGVRIFRLQERKDDLDRRVAVYEKRFEAFISLSFLRRNSLMSHYEMRLATYLHAAGYQGKLPKFDSSQFEAACSIKKALQFPESEKAGAVSDSTEKNNGEE